MNTLNKAQSIAIFAIIAAFFVITSIKQSKIESLENELKTANEEVVYKYDTRTDTINVIVTPEPIIIKSPAEIRIDSIYVDRPVTKIDTIKIFPTLQQSYIDWVKLREYQGVIKNDSSATMNYTARIQYNKLSSLTIDHTNHYPQTITERVKYNPRRIYAGVGIMNNGLNTQIGLMTRRGLMYEINYDVATKNFGASVKMKLFDF